MRYDPADAGLVNPVGGMRSLEPRSGQSGDFVAAALAAVVAELQPGWIVLQDCLLDTDGGVRPARIPYALLHGQVGIALLDFVPGNVTPDAAQRLKLMLERAGVSARYGRPPPIIYLCIPKRTVPGLAWVLEHEFRKLAPLAVPRDSSWTRLVQRLLAGERDAEAPAPGGAKGERENPEPSKIRRRPAGTSRRGRGSRWRNTALGLLALAFGGTVGLYAATPLESRLALLASGGWDGVLDRVPWLPSHGHAGEEVAALAAAEPPRILPIAFAENLPAPASEEAELPVTAAMPLPPASPDEALFALPSRGVDPPAEKLAALLQPLRGGLPPDAPGEGQADGTNAAMAAPLPEPAIRPAEPEMAQPADPVIPVEDRGTTAEPVSVPVPPPSPAEAETPPAQAVAAEDAAPAPAAAPAAPRDEAPALTLLAGTTPALAVLEPGPELVMASLPVIPAEALATTADAPPTPAAAPSEPDEARPDSQAEPAPVAVSATGASPSLPAVESSAPGPAALPEPAERSGDLAAQRKPEEEPEARPAPDLSPPPREVAETPAPPPAPLAEAAPPAPQPSPPPQVEQPQPVQVAATIPAPVAPQAAPPAPNPAFAQAAIQRGDAMMRLGDISAARLLYQRAATAGSGQAAIAMGRTYDPAFLAANRAQGILGDRDQAATWYRRALALGVAEARDRLAALGADESQ